MGPPEAGIRLALRPAAPEPDVSTSRPPPIPLESPSPARSRSLRSILWFGVALFLVLWIGSFVVVTQRASAGIVLIVLGSVLSVTMVVWVLRRTAGPLEELSRLASSNASFPAPEGAAGVREVDTLAWALHELDLAVRDREERLAEAHLEAVELSRFGEHVQQVVEESELHDALTARLIAVSDAHAAVTLVRNAGHGRLEVARATAAAAEHIHLPILDEPSRCRAVRNLKPVMCDGGTPTACKCDLVPAAGSSLCEPMLAAGELVGVVTLQANWRAHFTDRIQKRVHASLGFGATALASLRLLAATRERALRDPLTGAYNRAFLTEFLNKQLSAAARRDVGLGVLAVDLDHFKRLNDTHGHAAGDRALIATVEAIQREVRTSDAVVRHGGEELIVVLVDTDLAGAGDAAERIRAAIEAISIDSELGPVAVRASLGVAVFPEHGHDQTSLLAAADRALYRAKDLGRNRVINAERRDSAALDAQN
jgi:diguanylate cyclase (GGDEF)-like protein